MIRRAPLKPPSASEKTILGEKVKSGYRLSCDTFLNHGAAVIIPEEGRISEPVILTRFGRRVAPSQIAPPLERFSVTVPPPVMDPVLADRERFLLALDETHGLKDVSLDPHILKRLPGVLREEQGRLTATVRDRRHIVDVVPAGNNGFFGIAFDLGSTTVVGILTDLSNGRIMSVRAALNPQVSHGEDVITRISFCRESEEGLETLRKSVLNCLNTLICETCLEAGIHSDRILEATLVGNTAMHHLFMGLDPQYLAMAPYTPVLQESQNLQGFGPGN